MLNQKKSEMILSAAENSKDLLEGFSQIISKYDFNKEVNEKVEEINGKDINFNEKFKLLCNFINSELPEGAKSEFDIFVNAYIEQFK
jgi:hypothetical protein